MRSTNGSYISVAVLSGLLVLAMVTPGVTPTPGFNTPSARLDANSQVQGPRRDSTAPPTVDDRGSVTASSPANNGPRLSVGGTNSPPPVVPTSQPKPRPAPPTPPPPTPWPGAGNTGVPAGTVLSPHTGNLVVIRAGTVIDALDISNGCIDIQASNVTIKRTRVRGGVCGSNQIQLVVGTTGALIEDTEVDGLDQYAFYAGIGGSGFTCLRCNIHNVGQGFNITGSASSVIQDSYVHDLYACCGSHNEDIYVGGTPSLIIRHNTLGNAYTQTSAISLFADGGPVQNVTLDHNLLNGGGYALYGGSSCPKPYCTQTRNIVVTNNHFGRLFFPKCGYYNAVTAFDPTLQGNVWSGDVWDDTGQPITP